MVKEACGLVSAVSSEFAFVMGEVALLPLPELIAVPLESAGLLAPLIHAH